jgi:FkbM family methyltransferase
MITQFPRFANDCYHILRAPTGSKLAILRDLVFSGENKMGFHISYFDRSTLNYLYREVFARQHYYFRAQTQSPVILDCGANIGMASLYFKWLYPGSHVIAFEPDPATFRLLKENIARNKLDIGAQNFALWDENSEVDFFIDGGEPGALLMSTSNARVEGRCIRVPTRKLSDFIEGPIDFLKMDVEGAEHRILNDLVHSGKIRLIAQMVIEYHHRIGNNQSCLGHFLRNLEDAGFQYQLHAALYPVTARDTFQDILIAAQR